MLIDPNVHARARFNTLVQSLSAAAGIAIFVGLMTGGLVYSTGYLFLGLTQAGFVQVALALSVLTGIGAGIGMAISGYDHQYPVELADLTRSDVQPEDAPELPPSARAPLTNLHGVEPLETSLHGS